MRYGQRPLRGIGGWLAVFVATLALSALMNAAAGYGVIVVGRREQTSAMQSFFDVVAGSFIAAAVGYTCIAWLLIARQRAGTVRIAVSGLWLAALIPLIVSFVGERLLFGQAYFQDNYYVVLSPGAFGPLGYAAIWTVYLLRSDRVANTYAPRDATLADVFG